MKIKNNNGKYKISEMSIDQINLIMDAVGYFRGLLDGMIDKSTYARNYYQDWSICLILMVNFRKKTNTLSLSEKYSQTLYLHELFILQEAVITYENRTSEYGQSLCREIIMIINPVMPVLSSNHITSRL